MSELIFYTNPQSRGQIARWMLEEIGAEYQTQVVEYGPAMKSAEYLSINPMGKVPALVHRGQSITECAAICAYLAAAFPEKNLGPDAGQEASYYRWLFYAAGPVESALTNRALGFEANEEQQRMAGYGNYDLVVNTLDEYFADREFVCGDKFTAADVYLGSHIDWGLQFGTLTETENFKRYAEGLRARPAKQAALAKDMALMPSE